MAQAKQSRHTHAFILLFLYETSAYGAQILSRLQTEFPFCLSDSPSVYRSLQEMEEKGWIKATWETTPPGPPRKWYQMTALGQTALDAFAQDILQRQANFEFFLSRYSTIKST